MSGRLRQVLLYLNGILVSREDLDKLVHKHIQGLPWLRICCSQYFSQMEKVGAKWNLL